MSTQLETAAAAAASPYVGLSYYTEDRADVFFGRDGERKLITTNLRAARLTLLYAQSGVGKSSLLRAGVMPRFREAARDNYDRRGHATHIPILFSSWRDDPVEEFHAELERAIGPFRLDQADAPLPRASLREAFSAAVAATEATPLVILDQFEEYFLYRTGETRPGQFADEIAESINARDLRVNFLIAVREDAYAGLGDLFSGKIANVYGNYLHLEYLSRDAAREAIVKPIEQFNRDHPPGDAVTLEPDLIDAVLDEVRTGQVVFEQAGKGAVASGNGARAQRDEIETPYLQLVMATLWRHELSAGSSVLRSSTLEQLGGAQEIVRTHLDDALAGLSAEQREAAVDIFDHLVTPSGTKIVHRIPDLASYSGRDRALVEALVDKLSGGQQRILRPVAPPPGDSAPRVEIFHDVLAPAILAWRTGQTAARLEREKRQAELTAVRERRRARIFRALAVAASALLLLAVGAVVFAEVQRSQADRARRNAQSAQLASAALSDFQRGTLAPGLLLSIEAYQTAPTAEARDDLVQGLDATDGMVAYFSSQNGPVPSVAFSPNGRILASASTGDTVTLWDIRTRRKLRTLSGTNAVESVAFSPDGLTVASASADGTVALWNVATGRRLRTLRAQNGVAYGVAFSPDGRTVASASADGSVALWDDATGKRLRTLHGNIGIVYGVAFSPGGNLLAAAGHNGNITLWDVSTGRPVRTLLGHTEAVYGVAFSPDGRTLASASADKRIILWDVARGRAVRTLRGRTGSVNAVAFNPTGNLLAWASKDGTVGVWNLATRRMRFVRRTTSPVESVAFSPNGTTIASGSDDQSVVVWNATPPPLPVLSGPSRVLGVAFSPKQNEIATAGNDGSVILWSVATRQPVRILPGSGGPAEAVAFSPDGRMLGAAAANGSVAIWDVSTGRLVRRLVGGAALYALAFSPNGTSLATAGADGSATLWDVRTGEVMRDLRVDDNPIYTVAYSPDGRMLAAAGADSTVVLWQVSGGRRLRTLAGHTSPVEAVAFDSTGKMLASGGDDHTVVLWDVGSGREIGAPLRGHQDNVSSVAFSPNGKIVASGSLDGTVIVWNLRTLLGRPLDDHTAGVTSIAFSPDGGTLASGSGDRTVVLFRSFPSASGPGPIYSRLCDVVHTNLTRSEWNELVPGRSYRRTCPGLP